jgi:hypothetical protein
MSLHMHELSNVVARVRATTPIEQDETLQAYYHRTFELAIDEIGQELTPLRREQLERSEWIMRQIQELQKEVGAETDAIE